MSRGIDDTLSEATVLVLLNSMTRGTGLEDHVQPDGGNKSAYSAMRLVELFFYAFRCQVLIINNERLGDIAVAKVNDGRTAKKSWNMYEL